MPGSYICGTEFNPLSAAKLVNVGQAGEKQICLGHESSQFRCLLCAMLVCNMNIFVSCIETGSLDGHVRLVR